jgi:hypothetical protein
MILSLIKGEKIKEAIQSYNFMLDLLTSIKSERTYNKTCMSQIFLLCYMIFLNRYHFSDSEQDIIKD